MRNMNEFEKIGNRRVDRLKAMYESYPNYFVLIHPYNETDVDMLVFKKEGDNAILIEVLEITNYAKPTFYINDKKFDRYVNCLQKFAICPHVQRTLYISYWSNLNDEQHKTLAKLGIHVIEVGSQDTEEEEKERLYWHGVVQENNRRLAIEKGEGK
jgi:hypothetical protein